MYYYRHIAQETSRQYFYPNHQLKQEQSWKLGKLLNVTAFYSIKGEELNPGTLMDGTGTYLEYYPEGEIKLKAELVRGIMENSYKGYHLDYRLSFEGSMKNGEKYGIWTYYHFNGVQESTGEYQKGNKIGEWRYFNRVGRLINLVKY